MLVQVVQESREALTSLSLMYSTLEPGFHSGQPSPQTLSLINFGSLDFIP